MDDEERAREEREQVVNPNRFANVRHCCKGRHCCRDGSCKVIDFGPEKQSGIAPKPEDYDDAPPLCICTEPPSDSARRAGMSWGGVSETIRGACPLCQGADGCPPECRSLKPHGYADAPQWQKDAWDSDINKLMQDALDALKKPSTGGWAMPSEVLYGNLDIPLAPEYPAIGTIRGGILYPRYVVQAEVRKARKRFLRRQTWNVDVSYYDVSQKSFMNHIMEGFPAENLAGNAAEIIKFMIMNINEQYHEEKRRDRKTAR